MKSEGPFGLVNSDSCRFKLCQLRNVTEGHSTQKSLLIKTSIFLFKLLVLKFVDVLLNFLGTYQPDRTLIIHQPLNGIDYDGESKELAEHLSEKSGIRVKRLGSRSGSMGTHLGLGLKKQVITLEIPARYSEKTSEQVCEKYCVLLKEFISYSVEKQILRVNKFLLFEE